MLHLLYIFAFTAVAILAIANLVRSLITLGQESNRRSRNREDNNRPMPQVASPRVTIPHPELLDSNGQPVNEPLLVMRSVDVEEAREKLDALYRSSPGTNDSDR